ncbi:hypothetical protein [Prosthecobacter sp.]|uniref:tetratricopeptide repeat protein n=1 Tax=Prosthecobacter sp. TaxID=1965333 RepID=UPI001D4DD611|nr:hypothetical protein [Prosthecobacter sp.]MCB1275174.1 hypothetical protein [Prosthecobacter sp.]
MPAPPRKGMGAGMIVLIVVVIVVLLVAVLAALAIPGYQRIQKMAEEIKHQQSAAFTSPPPLTAPQKEALGRFGNELAEALGKKDMAKVMALQNGEALAARVFGKLPAGIPNSAEMRRGFLEGIKKRDGGWMWSVIGNEVKFLRIRERNGFPAVLLRVKSAEGAVNYVDVLAMPEGGSFRAVDMFNYVFATMVSEESRNALAAMVSKSVGGGFAAMLGIPKMDESAVDYLSRINDATRAGNMMEVLRICDGMPQALKTQRIFFILRLQALMVLSSSAELEPQYKEALRAAPDILGKDSTTDLLMVDLLFMENDLKGAEECLKRVDAVVGGDPYLKFLRGGARLQMKDYAGALELASQVAREDPKMVDVIDLRLSVHLALKDFKGVADDLRVFKRDFGHVLDRNALAGDPAYAEFLASPEFAAWEKEIAVP